MCKWMDEEDKAGSDFIQPCVACLGQAHILAEAGLLKQEPAEETPGKDPNEIKIEQLTSKLNKVLAVLQEEPDPCPEHSDEDDPVSCGWKSDIILIRDILSVN